MSEYDSVKAIIQGKPAAPDGYAYKLRADNYEWELAEDPPTPDEEAEIEDYKNALSDLGVRV